MKIRKYISEDFNIAKAFIESCCSSEDVPVNLLNQGTAILGFAEEDKIVGLAMQWRNELHNKTIVIEICVHQSKRRCGLGTQLFKSLLDQYPLKKNDFALDIKCKSENIAAQGFAKSLGFQKYLKCYNNIFNIDEMKKNDSNLVLTKLSDYYSDGKNKNKVMEFHCFGYDRDHEPFLPLNNEKEIRYDYFCDGDSDYGAVLLNNDELVGCSFAFFKFRK